MERPILVTTSTSVRLILIDLSAEDAGLHHALYTVEEIDSFTGAGDPPGWLQRIRSGNVQLQWRVLAATKDPDRWASDRVSLCCQSNPPAVVTFHDSYCARPAQSQMVFMSDGRPSLLRDFQAWIPKPDRVSNDPWRIAAPTTTLGRSSRSMAMALRVLRISKTARRGVSVGSDPSMPTCSATPARLYSPKLSHRLDAGHPVPSRSREWRICRSSATH